LDTAALSIHWPEITIAAISADRRYVSFNTGVPGKVDKLTVRSADNVRQQKLWVGNVRFGGFSANCQHAWYCSGDTLRLIGLGVDRRLYLQNIPVFQADRVICPILLFANNRDNAVSFPQAAEMYMALRCLGKPCWMLQFDKVSHSVTEGELDCKDYMVLQMQFFDHYLKGAPCASVDDKKYTAQVKPHNKWSQSRLGRNKAIIFSLRS